MTCQTCPRSAAWHRRQIAQLESELGPEAGLRFESEHPEGPAQSFVRWSQREQIGYRQEPYYNVTVYRVPVVGADTDAAALERIRSALYDRWSNSLTGSSVGGYSTPRVLASDTPGTVIIESVYHIGD